VSPRLLPGRRAGRTKQKGAGGSLVELVTIVAVALGLALGIQAFLVKPFRIPSESMVPTLQIGQRVLVDRISKNFSDYGRGDILVFKPPAGADTTSCGVQHSETTACPTPTKDRSDTNFIKRVVAVGGDRIKVLGGHVYLNGERQNESFARFSDSCDICNLPDEIRIPKGYYFMMGDNRGASADSRVWGPIPKDWVIGQAFATYWPPKKIGTL
jgi:signal peptidase I